MGGLGGRCEVVVVCGGESMMRGGGAGGGVGGGLCGGRY